MGEIVNLNRWKKARSKRTDEAQAAANRVAHGRTAAKKKADEKARTAREKLLDGARRDEEPS